MVTLYCIHTQCGLFVDVIPFYTNGFLLWPKAGFKSEGFLLHVVYYTSDTVNKMSKEKTNVHMQICILLYLLHIVKTVRASSTV